jgi:hypothetical protein
MLNFVDFQSIWITCRNSSNLIIDSHSTVIRSIIGARIIIVIPSEQSQHVHRKNNRTQNLPAAYSGATVKGIVAVEHEAAIRQ